MIEQNFVQKINKIYINIKTCHNTSNMSYDFNLESHNIRAILIKTRFYLIN